MNLTPEQELVRLRIIEHAYNRLMLCSDHRDKADGERCICCQVEHNTREEMKTADGEMKQRSNIKLEIGQIWQSSDPRRLRAVQILETTAALVRVFPVYPCRYPFNMPYWTDIVEFARLGSKGYTRVS